MFKEKSVDNNEKRTTLSLSLSVDDKKALKKYAADHEITVAAVVHEWIHKYCVEVTENGEH